MFQKNLSTPKKEAARSMTPNTADASLAMSSGFIAAVGTLATALGIKSRKKND